MGSLENLFAVEPTLPSTQTHKMPDNPERWAEVLTTYLREQYPDSSKLPITVEFRKRDDQSGTAIGALICTSEEASKTLLVPFIIKKFELAPLDIWMEAKTQDVHPMTKDTFKEVFFVQSPAEGMDQRPTDSTGTYFNDPSLWTTNYPPLQGRYSYASAGYQILDQLSDTFTKEDVDSFKQVLMDNPHLVAKFKKHGHAEVIEKLAKKTSFPATNDYVASAMQLIPTAALSVKKEDNDKYSILSMAEGLFDHGQVQRMDRSKCEHFLSKIIGSPKDVLNEVDEEGEKLLIIRKPAPGVFLYDAAEAGPEEAKDFAVYRVKTSTGLQLDGVVVPYVVNFSGKRLSKKLFISANHSSCQSSIAGIRMVGIDDKPIMHKLLKPWDIRVGATGCFMYLDDGKAVATEPVTIKAIEEYGPLTVVDMSGKKFNVKRGYGDYFEKNEKEALEPSKAALMPGGKNTKPKRTYLDAHGFIEVRKEVFVIPEKMLWIPMQDLSDVSATPAEWMMKEASSKMTADPLTLRWTGIVYDISGNGLPKMAASETETKVLLATSGLDHAKIATVLKKAKATGRAKVHGADKLESKASKTSNVTKMIAKIASLVAVLKKDFTKEAAEMGDSDKERVTVDALLGLNFLNANNMAKFVAYKPVLDKVLDYLAELTMAARLGLNDVPEGATVIAMTKLMEVADGLQKIQVSMKRPATKTAAAPAAPALKTSKRYAPTKLIAMIS